MARASGNREAEHALADGEITGEEADSYIALAEELQVEPELAGEIIASAQRRHSHDGGLSCPHCGKAIT